MNVAGASPSESLNGDSPAVSASVGEQPLDFLDLEFWPAETNFQLDQMTSTMEWLGQLDAQAGGNPLAGQQPGAQQDLRGDAGGQEAADGQAQSFQAQLNGATPDMQVLSGISASVALLYAACTILHYLLVWQISTQLSECQWSWEAC